ncbi:hypothetical protein LTR60_004098, partial [Cryomyces antarcticus]
QSRRLHSNADPTVTIPLQLLDPPLASSRPQLGRPGAEHKVLPRDARDGDMASDHWRSLPGANVGAAMDLGRPAVPQVPRPLDHPPPVARLPHQRRPHRARHRRDRRLARRRRAVDRAAAPEQGGRARVVEQRDECCASSSASSNEHQVRDGEKRRQGRDQGLV